MSVQDRREGIEQYVQTFMRADRADIKEPLDVVFFTALGSGKKVIDIDAVIQSGAAACEFWESITDLFGNKIAAAQDKINRSKATPYGRRAEPGKPLAMHVENNFRFRIQDPNDRRKLRKIENVNDIAALFPGVERNLESVPPVVPAGLKRQRSP